MPCSAARVLLVPAMLVATLFPLSAWAQAAYYITPSLTVSEVYDDNIFNATRGNDPNAAGRRRESDFITRLTPGVTFGYQSDPLTVLFNYSFTIERFVDHPELDNEGGFQSGTMTLNYVPYGGSPWTFLGSGFYTKSENPEDVDILTGVRGGRRSSTSYGVAPGVRYQFSSSTALSTGYAYSHTEVEGGVASTSHGFHAGLTGIPVSLEYGVTGAARYGLTILETETAGISSTARNQDLGFSLLKDVRPQDTFSLNYEVSVLERENRDTSVSHVGTVGWIHRFVREISAGADVGVRITDGRIGPEVRVNVDARSGLTRDLTFSLTTTSEVRTVLDTGDIVRTQTYAGSVAYQTPIRYLTVTASPSMTQVLADKGNRDQYIYSFRARVSYSYPIQSWLNAFARYDFSYVDSGREIFQPAGREIIHNTFSIGLTASYPYRIH